MKKLLLLVLLFGGLAFGQTEFLLKDLGNGNAYANDSLYYVYVDTSATPDDTLSAVVSKYFVNKGVYEWMYITMTDTGSTFTDTISIRGKAPYTSKWNDVEFIRDSTWTNTQPVPDNASIHSYSVWIKNLYGVGIFLTNGSTLDTNHVHYFDIQLVK